MFVLLYRSRGVKKSHLKLQSLLCPSPPDTSTSSLGYHSEGEETDSSGGESEGVEISEDLALLEDEGVTGLSCGRKHTIHKVCALYVHSVLQWFIIVLVR